MWRTVCALTVCLSLLPSLAAQGSKKKKKNEEPVTQVLPLPKDLPNAITADVDRLVFFTSPLTTKGLLTAQTREALRYLTSASKSSTIVKLRAFVAGSGDTRRIATLVSEWMTEHKLPLPALSTVQVGSLGLEGSQVVIEAIATVPKPVNPNGLAFISGQVGTTYKEAMGRLAKAVEAAQASEVLSMTCFVSSLEDTAADRVAGLPAGLSGTPIVVQMRREPSPTAAECEAVVRLKTKPAQAVVLVSPESLAASLPRYSQIALVAPGKIAFTGLQLCFHDQQADAKLAFERLGRTLESVQVKYSNVFFTHTYALSLQSMDLVRGVRFQFLDQSHPPASTLLPFEGLPSLDASFGIEVVAVVP